MDLTVPKVTKCFQISIFGIVLIQGAVPESVVAAGSLAESDAVCRERQVEVLKAMVPFVSLDQTAVVEKATDVADAVFDGMALRSKGGERDGTEHRVGHRASPLAKVDLDKVRSATKLHASNFVRHTTKLQSSNV